MTEFDIEAARERQTERLKKGILLFSTTDEIYQDLEAALKRIEELGSDNERLSSKEYFFDHVAEHRGQSEPHVFCPICEVTHEDMIPPPLGDDDGR